MFWCSSLFGTSVLVDLFLVLHASLPIPRATFFVLRDTDQTIPLHESFQTHIAVEVIYLCSNSGTSLSGSTVSLLLLSFTLNQASASTNHSIVPSRGNGKFTCLGWFMRGCFGAWLYWSGSWIYDSWNGLSSSHTQKGSSLLFLGGKHLGYGACLWFPFMIPILSWAVLCSLGSWVFPTFDPQLIMLETLWFYLLLSYTSLWTFDLQMIAWDTPYHQLSISQHSTPCPHRLGGEYFREKRSFSGLIFPLTKGLRHIAEIPLFFLFFSFLKKDDPSDLGR